MDQEVAPALEGENQILPAPADVGDALARELGGDDLGELGTGEPPVGDLDALEAPADEPRGEARPDRLDFGQLGHWGSSLGEDGPIESSSPVELRTLVSEDWPSVAEIFAEGIQSGDPTLETEVPSWDEWDASHLATPRLVAILGEGVVGWAALVSASPRPAYGGVAEDSVYVSASARGRGVGRRLLELLVAESERVGIWTVQAAMFPENEASIALHHSCGFRTAGVRERLGKVNGVWRDVVLLERRSNVVS
jgi:L-amino acid N-acyltransferase YncA